MFTRCDAGDMLAHFTDLSSRLRVLAHFRIVSRLLISCAGKVEKNPHDFFCPCAQPATVMWSNK